MLDSESTGRSCVACGVGTVIKIRVSISTSQNVRATGGKIHRVYEYYCDNYGVMYAFPPPPAK
jgi:hypothetical protein